jgi:5-methylcytosine-specific restriction protein B
MERSPRARKAFYAAAARFVDTCLRAESSLFTPDQAVWSAVTVTNLYKLSIENLTDSASWDFVERLRCLLENCSQDVIQLAAEVLYVFLLPQDTSLAIKRENVVAILNLSPEPVGLPDELSEALAHGLASYGAVLSQRFPQYVFLLEFANAWTKCEKHQREEILSSADRFREFVLSLPRKAASSQVQALLHIVFPAEFEPIVSLDAKRKIVEAFKEMSPDSSLPIDKRIAVIRQALSGKYGDHFNFYDPYIRALWEREKDEYLRRERAWLVRAINGNSQALLSRWFDEEFVSLELPSPQSFGLDASEEEIRDMLAQANPDQPPGQVRRSAGMGKRFLSMSKGDLVLTPDADQLYVARVTDDAHWSEDEQIPYLRRQVEWLNRDAPARRRNLKQASPSLYARLQTLLTVCELPGDLSTVRRLVTPDENGSHSKRGRGSVLPPITDELAESLYLPRAWLQHSIDLLHEKQQVIFYGPPGTGKTFVAQALGQHLRLAGGDWQLVQFHPAYSYEDFFEGYRPSKPEDDGALQFDLRMGPLRLLAREAATNPDRPYLLVIDEINRGNIAKIFGELYFLLEYRDRPIRLQYSPEQPFVLPKNLFLLGTMNTADRSIALVDSALRRRFYFFPFLPQESPVRDVLSLWLAEKGYDEQPSRLLAALNHALREALPDEDFTIGPSYFMPKEGPPNLEFVWRYAIRPLLEERFYGARRPDELEQEFGLQATLTRLEEEDLLAGVSADGEGEPQSPT